MFCCSSIYMNFLLDLDNMFEISGSACCTYFGTVDLTNNTHILYFSTYINTKHLYDVDLISTPTDFHNFRHFFPSINGPLIYPHNLKQNISFIFCSNVKYLKYKLRFAGESLTLHTPGTP